MCGWRVAEGRGPQASVKWADARARIGQRMRCVRAQSHREPSQYVSPPSILRRGYQRQDHNRPERGGGRTSSTPREEEAIV